MTNNVAEAYAMAWAIKEALHLLYHCTAQLAAQLGAWWRSPKWALQQQIEAEAQKQLEKEEAERLKAEEAEKAKLQASLPAYDDTKSRQKHDFDIFFKAGDVGIEFSVLNNQFLNDGLNIEGLLL